MYKSNTKTLEPFNSTLLCKKNLMGKNGRNEFYKKVDYFLKLFSQKIYFKNIESHPIICYLN